MSSGTVFAYQSVQTGIRNPLPRLLVVWVTKKTVRVKTGPHRMNRDASSTSQPTRCTNTHSSTVRFL